MYNEIYGEICNLKVLLAKGDYYLTESSTLTENSDLQKIILFCEKTGTKLRIVLDVLCEQVEFLMTNDELCQKALAGPRMTMKILRILPLIAVLLSILFGANPLRVYFSPVGILCIIVGLFFWVLGSKIISSKVKGFESMRITNLLENPVIHLNLLKSTELSGISFSVYLAYFYPEVTRKLEQSVPIGIAGLPDHFSCIFECYNKGLAMSPSIDGAIMQLKMQMSTEMKVKAEELEVSLTVPLAACFLPSFIFLGVIPVILGLTGILQ